MTCVIGTSSTSRSRQRSRHIPRATSPCRRLTPLAARLLCRANWVTPNGSWSSSGFVRPRRTSSHGSMPSCAEIGTQRLADLVDRVGVVAGGHRRVRREERAAAHGLERLVGVEPAADERVGELEPGECGVALVEVHGLGVDADRLDRLHPADAQQDVLREADLGIARVQARGRPAGAQRVLRPVGVEEEERHAPDVDPPHLRDEVHAVDLHRDRERRAVVARDERGREAVGVGVDPVLVLHARRVDPLAEVALAVQEADGGERGGLVGGLLEDVARERAEAAGVDRQRRVDAVLGAEEDGAAAADVGARGHLGGDPALDLLGPRDEAVVGRRAQQRARRRLLEQVDGVVARALPPVGVDVVEELRPARPPGPAVVVREAGEHPQALGHP